MRYVTNILMLLLIGCGIAWTSQASDPTDTQNASKAFVNKASMSSLFEIKAAEIALTRSKTPQVRQVAEKLIQDHKESSEKLRTLLLRENLKLDPSMDLDSEHFEKLKKLNDLDASDFDAGYLSIQEKAHQQTIETFESFLREENASPALKRFASETLPTLKAHYQKIDQTQKKPGKASFLQRNRSTHVQLAKTSVTSDVKAV